MPRRSRPWSTLCLGICVCMLLPGCWSRIEINDRAFVTIMMIDKAENNEIELTLGFPLPNRLIPGQVGGTTNAGNPYTVLTKKAANIADAYRMVQSDLSRQINWGQMRVVVLGKRMAEDGIGPVLEFAAREPDFHIKTYVFIAPGKAKDLADAPPVFERFLSEELREYAKQRVVLDTDIKDLLVSRYYGEDSIIALLTLTDMKLLSEKNKNEEWLGTGGAAILRDGKMVTKLNTHEMRGALWLTNEMEDAVITLKSPKDGGNMSFRILKGHTKVKPVIKGKRILFKVHAKAKDDVISIDSDVNPEDPVQAEKLGQMLSREVEHRMKAAFIKSQKVGADAFGFGQILEWHYPKVWNRIKKDWASFYEEQVDFEVSANIEVNRTGGAKEPVWSRMMDFSPGKVPISSREGA